MISTDRKRNVSMVYRNGNYIYKTKTPEYMVWACMKRRCYEKRRKDYRWYGGRGITVCQRWLNSFDNFYSDMGQRPSEDLELDRIDNNGNYGPTNCRWATKKVNKRNTRSVLWIEVFGEKIKIRDAAEKYGIGRSTLSWRYKQGLRGKDLVRKPTDSSGENNPMAKFKNKDLVRIVKMKEIGIANKEISETVGISSKYITELYSKIKSGKRKIC